MKSVLKLLGVTLFLALGYYVWQVHFNYRFETISEEKVYKSGLIAPDKLEGYLVEHKIKTVIDLLDPGVQDRLNPAQQKHVDAEDRAIKAINEKHNLSINHVHIPSGQVPTKETLTKFFEVLDKEENYPVLIHCYHGTGRATIYSALYRIEYENWSNEEARQQTRMVVEALGYRSAFAQGRSKGDFLIGYQTRTLGDNSTLTLLKD